MGFIRNNFSIIPKDNYHGDPNQLDLGEGYMAKGHGKGSYLNVINRGMGWFIFKRNLCN